MFRQLFHIYFFLFLLFQLVVYQKDIGKIICLMAMCTVSMLGYSALMAIPMFISITLIMMIMILKKENIILERDISIWDSVYSCDSNDKDICDTQVGK